MAKKPLYRPTGLPPIQSQNSQLQTAHSMPIKKPSRPASKLKANNQHSMKLLQGPAPAVKKGRNAKRVPSGHC